MFVDSVAIRVRGGSGGAGVSSFLRRKGLPKGRPNGGSGGAGGNVVLVADSQVPTLLRYDRHPDWKAPSGTHGEGDLRHGRQGQDLRLPVPLGTVVKDEDGRVIADLVEDGQELVVARGGKGGKGNAAFVSPARKAPTFAEQGEFGEEVEVRLELKLLADAALIGYPNAGKSTLIARVSAAKPKIADYPFTTLVPNLGVVSIGDREIVLADVPGLIEGAASGKGLGHEFLRHTERARALVVLLDPSPLQVDSPARQLEVLLGELEQHDPALAARERIVVVSKAELLDHDAFDVLGLDDDVRRISAMTGEGVDELMYAIADLVEEVDLDTPQREGFILHRPLRADFTIRRDGDEWVVEGIAAVRAVNLSDLTDPDAAEFVAKRLAGSGIVDGLIEAGAEPGDDVRIGSIVFTFDPDSIGEEDIFL
ncbi:GTP-binding protein Obg [hydrothermal vent metagenome]|uniref:GTP-binding protein Obg n=1 Tax=hydrothermal vent metagenome TaxID=652676 RepID=A0A3B0SXQ7_9ZZZZ